MNSGVPQALKAAHRVVERFVAHGEPVSFRRLCAEVLSPKTRYLVLDLDGTIHLRRNLGELLGWELAAHKSYGLQTLQRLEHCRNSARWVFEWRAPLRVARYLAESGLLWAVPGTRYFVWGTVASHSPRLRRFGFHRFGDDPIRIAQRGVQATLMEELEAAPAEIVPTLMQRIWQRHMDDQVITAEDIRWTRERFPRLEIILSSASPQPVVAFVAEKLGIAHAHGSKSDRINSGKTKIETLRQSFTELGQPDVEVVGVSDTDHGDDHCWTEYFTKVVDINSRAPFPLIVPIDSPVREVHSAIVLSRGELEQRASDPTYFDPRRGSIAPPPHRELNSTDLHQVMRIPLERFNEIVSGAVRLANPSDLAYRLEVLRESSRASITERHDI